LRPRKLQHTSKRNSSTGSYFKTAGGIYQQEVTLQQEEETIKRNLLCNSRRNSSTETYYTSAGGSINRKLLYNSRTNSSTGSYFTTAGEVHQQEVTTQ
jgi:hypothetical protein